MDRNVLLAVAAAQEAWDDAGLDGVDPRAVGILVGSAIGGIATIAEQQQVFAERGPDRVSPFFIPSVLVDTASGQIAIQLGLKGTELRTGLGVRDRLDRDRRGGGVDPARPGGRRARRRHRGADHPADPRRLLRDARASSPRRRIRRSRRARSTRRAPGS